MRKTPQLQQLHTFAGVLETLVFARPALHVAALRRTLHMRQADADATEEADAAADEAAMGVLGFMGSEEYILHHR